MCDFVSKLFFSSIAIHLDIFNVALCTGTVCNALKIDNRNKNEEKNIIKQQ